MEVASVCPLRVARLVWRAPRGALTLTVVCKGTFALVTGEAHLLDEQEPPNEDDNHWNDDPSRSLYAASDLVPFKARADVLLVGHAFAPNGLPVRKLVARLRAAGVDKAIEIASDAPFARMPLRYERASGFRVVGAPPIEGGSPPGFGPIAPSWRPRRQRLAPDAAAWLAGGIDKAPMPDDLDPAFFNVAPRDQQIETIEPDAEIQLDHLDAQHAQLVTRLPGVFPRASIEGHGAGIALRCDTLWIDTDRRVATLTWRGNLEIDDSPPGARVIVSMETLPPLSRRGPLPSIPPRSAPAPSEPPPPFTIGGAAAVDSSSSESTSPSIRAMAASASSIAPAPVAGSSSSIAAPPAPVTGSSSSIATPSAPVTGSSSSIATPSPVVGSSSSIAALLAPVAGSSSSTAAPPAPVAGSWSSVAAPPAVAASSSSVAAPPSASATPQGGLPSLAALASGPELGRSETLPSHDDIELEDADAEEDVPEPPSATSAQLPLSSRPTRPSLEAMAGGGIATVVPPAPRLPSTSGSIPAPVTAATPSAAPASPLSAPRPALATPPPPAAAAPASMLGTSASTHAPAPPAPSLASPSPAPTFATAITTSALAAPAAPSATTTHVGLFAVSASSSAAASFTPSVSSAPAASSSAAFSSAAPSSTAASTPPSPSAASSPEAAASSLAGRSARSRHVELLWLDPERAGAVRSHFKLKDAHERKAIAVLMAGPQAATPASLRASIGAAFADDGTFTPPFVLVSGELEMLFDGVDLLRALITSALPFTPGNRKLREAIDALEELLRTSGIDGSYANVVGRSIVARLKDEFAGANRSLPDEYLDDSATRLVLERRRYQRRTVFGEPWLRAQLHLRDKVILPTYLPEALATRLPMFQRMEVALVAEVHAAQDQYETHPHALRTVALGRAIARP